MAQTCRRCMTTAWLCAAVPAGATVRASETGNSRVECWDSIDLSLKGPISDNRFVDVRVSARSEKGGEVLRPGGFYDGDGVQRIGLAPFRATQAAWARAVSFRWSESGNTSRIDERVGRSAVCTVRFSGLQ